MMIMIIIDNDHFKEPPKSVIHTEGNTISSSMFSYVCPISKHITMICREHVWSYRFLEHCLKIWTNYNEVNHKYFFCYVMFRVLYEAILTVSQSWTNFTSSIDLCCRRHCCIIVEKCVHFFRLLPVLRHCVSWGRMSCMYLWSEADNKIST